MARATVKPAAPVAPAVPVMPTMEGEAYAANAVAPVLRAWLVSIGSPRLASTVYGGTIRTLVRGDRRGVESPIDRFTERLEGVNHHHDYTLDETRALFVTFARLAGKPDATLPEPFAVAPVKPVKPARKPATVKAPVARVKPVKPVATVKAVTPASDAS